MGWVWTDDDAAPASSHGSSADAHEFRISTSSSGYRCSTRKVVKTQCRTEEIEPGKLLRKCQKTEEIFKDCVGRPTELMQSNKEYTEEEYTKEDVTGQMSKGSLNLDCAEDIYFPGLNRDIEAFAHSFFASFDHVFEAAEEMKNGFFNVFGTPCIYEGDSSSATQRKGIPTVNYPAKEVLHESRKSDGDVDLSGLARDI